MRKLITLGLMVILIASATQLTACGRRGDLTLPGQTQQ